MLLCINKLFPNFMQNLFKTEKMRTNILFCIVILAFLLSFQDSEAQEIAASNKFLYKNAAEFDLFGHGLFYSFNYERLIINGDRFKTLAQVGAAYYPEATDVIRFWFPLTINQLYSINQHHIELGIGQILFDDAFNSVC